MAHCKCAGEMLSKFTQPSENFVQHSKNCWRGEDLAYGHQTKKHCNILFNLSSYVKYFKFPVLLKFSSILATTATSTILISCYHHISSMFIYIEWSSCLTSYLHMGLIFLSTTIFESGRESGRSKQTVRRRGVSGRSKHGTWKSEQKLAKTLETKEPDGEWEASTISRVA